MNKNLKRLIEKAILLEACDIHLLEKNEKLTIAYRGSSGMIDEKEEVSIELLGYLRYLANLDLSNSIKMQSGHFDIMTYKGVIPIRFSYMQTATLKTGVIRIMHLFKEIGVENLSKISRYNKVWYEIAKYKQGLFLIAGVMGSGKTTTMYALIDLMVSQNKNVMTLEDPIEIIKEDIVQLQVDHKTITYSEGIKQFLRHSPDVIIVGEIRDEKSASMAIRAALSGVLIISTIHAKSASGVINRLQEFGISTADLSATLKGVCYQKLIGGKNKEGIVLFDVIGEDEIYEVLTNNKIHHDDYDKQLNYLFKEGYINKKAFKEL